MPHSQTNTNHNHLRATLEALKRKDASSIQLSIAIPPTQITTNNEDDDLDVLLNEIDEQVNQHPPPKIAKILQSEEGSNLFNNISTDLELQHQIISETDIIEQKSIASPSGFDLCENEKPPTINMATHIRHEAITNIRSDECSLPFPISLQDDEININLIESNTKAICSNANLTKWTESTQDFIKVAQSLIFITRYEMIGSMYKLALIDASNIPFEGTAQSQIFAKIKAHYGMGLLISDFTLLFNFALRPHAIITTRNVISLYTNIHSIDDD